jgi:hypothetical protein
MAKVSDLLTGIAQLMLQGHFPGTHSKLVVEAINSLEFLANIERSKEGDQNNTEDESLANAETSEDTELDAVVDDLTERRKGDENGV